MYICTEDYSERGSRFIGTSTEFIKKPEIRVRAFYIPTRMTHELLRTNANNGLTLSHCKYRNPILVWKVTLAEEFIFSQEKGGMTHNVSKIGCVRGIETTPLSIASKSS